MRRQFNKSLICYLIFIIAICMVGITGCRKNKPPDAPSLPTSASYTYVDTTLVNDSTYFYTSATDPEKDNVSYQFNWGDGTLSNWSAYVSSGSPVSMGHKYLQVNKYLVRAKAKDIHKGESDWSQACTVIVASKSAPPESLTILDSVSNSASDSGYINATMAFLVRAVEPGGDSIKFRLKIEQKGFTRDSILSGFVASGATVSMHYAFLDTGIFQEVYNTGFFKVTARAQNRDGNVSEWSSPCSVKIIAPKPRTPSIPFSIDIGTMQNANYPHRFVYTPYCFEDTILGTNVDTIIQFNFIWGNDSSLTVAAQAHSKTEDLAYLSNSYTMPGNFNVTAQLIDRWGQYSDKSVTLPITIESNFLNSWSTIDTCLGIAIYKDTLYVVDWTNHKIEIFNTTGSLLGTIGGSVLKAPKYVAVDSNYIYVTDASNDVYEVHKVYVFNRNGTVKTSFGGIGTGEGEFSYPTGIAADAGYAVGKDYVYVMDSFNKRIQKFVKRDTIRTNTISKIDTTTIDTIIIIKPDTTIDTIINPDTTIDTVIKPDTTFNFKPNTDTIFKLDTVFFKFVSKWTLPAEALGMKIYNGNLYIASHKGDAIYVFDTNGNTIGTIGAAAVDADGYFDVPCDVAVSNNGIYVIEASQSNNDNDRVQEFDMTGTFVNRWGEKGSANGQFNSAQGIAVDDAGNIYVVDTGNKRIQVFLNYGKKGFYMKKGEGISIHKNIEIHKRMTTGIKFSLKK